MYVSFCWSLLVKYMSISSEMSCQQNSDVKCIVFCGAKSGWGEVIVLENDALNQLPQPNRFLVTVDVFFVDLKHLYTIENDIQFVKTRLNLLNRLVTKSNFHVYVPGFIVFLLTVEYIRIFSRFDNL